MSILGKVSPQGTNHTLAYTCPAAKKASINLNATNRSDKDVEVTISLSKPDDLGIASVTVVNAGTGLTTIPDVSVTGDGSGAIVSVSSVKVTEVGILSGGTGYVVGNTLALVGGEGASATLTVTGVDADGVVTNVEIATAGVYTSVIEGVEGAVSVTGGAGEGFALDVAEIKYGVNSVGVVNQGNNYKTTPSLTVASGTGIELTAQMTRAAIEDNDALEYQVVIPARGVLERSGVVIGAGDAVFVKSSVADSTNFFVFGVEAIA